MAPARSLVWVITLAVALGTTSPTLAQRHGGRHPQTSAGGVGFDQSVALLSANDPAQIRSGIEALGLLGSPRAVDPISARIRRGLPADLLDSALDTLTVLGRPEAGPVLFALTSHRRAAVRVKAIEAIIACRPRGADRALASALNDSEGRVRAAAALGLGQLGSHGELDSLFLAFDRGVGEASTALGQLAQPADVARILGYLGRVPLDLVSPALNEVLARRDLPERSKLDVIAQLQELATGEAKNFLREFVASLPQDAASQSLRHAAEDAILRIAD